MLRQGVSSRQGYYTTDVLTLTHRYNAVRGHKTGSNKSGAEDYLGSETNKTEDRVHNWNKSYHRAEHLQQQYLVRIWSTNRIWDLIRRKTTSTMDEEWLLQYYCTYSCTYGHTWTQIRGKPALLWRIGLRSINHTRSMPLVFILAWHVHAETALLAFLLVCMYRWVIRVELENYTQRKCGENCAGSWDAVRFVDKVLLG